VPSEILAASSLPSGEKATEATLQPSTGNRFRSVPVATSQIRVEPFPGFSPMMLDFASLLGVANVVPSGENLRSFKDEGSHTRAP
jgi:hypothetical protein